MFLTNIKNGFSLTEVFNLDAISSVPYLSVIGGPPNVSMEIPKVVVNPVNGVLWRWKIANVLIKLCKAIEPFFAYCYSAPAVIIPMGVVWVCASLNHVFPNPMDWRSGLSMGLVCLGCALLVKAAARQCVAHLKACRKGGYFFSALANALP